MHPTKSWLTLFITFFRFSPYFAERKPTQNDALWPVEAGGNEDAGDPVDQAAGQVQSEQLVGHQVQHHQQQDRNHGVNLLKLIYEG